MDFERFYKLRRRLFELIRTVDEGYHKSYEGATDVTFSFTNIYESQSVSEPPESVAIELHCYLLIDDGRHMRITGRSFEECLDRFSAWLSEKEREVYENYR